MANAIVGFCRSRNLDDVLASFDAISPLFSITTILVSAANHARETHAFFRLDRPSREVGVRALNDGRFNAKTFAPHQASGGRIDGMVYDSLPVILGTPDCRTSRRSYAPRE